MSFSIIYLIRENIWCTSLTALQTQQYIHIKIAIHICPCTLVSRSLFTICLSLLLFCCVCKQLKLNYEYSRIYFAYATIHCLIVHVVYALSNVQIFFIRMQVKSALSHTHANVQRSIHCYKMNKRESWRTC